MGRGVKMIDVYYRQREEGLFVSQDISLVGVHGRSAKLKWWGMTRLIISLWRCDQDPHVQCNPFLRSYTTGLAIVAVK